MSLRPNPLWSKTPLVLFRFRELLVAVTAGALLLATAATAGAIFMSANATQALESAVQETNRYVSGLSIGQPADLYECTVPGRVVPEDPCPKRFQELWYRPRTEAITRATAGLDHLSRVTFTMSAQPVTLTAGRSSDGATSVRPLLRTKALQHISIVEEAGGEGIYIADIVADAEHLAPGDDATITGPSGTTTVRVAGVYRALVNEPPQPYWSSLYNQIHPPSPDAGAPPPFIIGDEDTILRIMNDTRDTQAQFQWEFPIATSAPLTFSDAQNVSDGFDLIGSRLSNVRTTLGRLFVCSNCARYGSANHTWGLDNAVDRARDNVVGLSAPVDLLTIAGTVVALVVIGAAGAYGIARRRSEAAFLFARGMSPATMGVKVAIESLIPVCLGAALGYGTASALVAVLGPGGTVDAQTIRSTLIVAALTAPAALVVLGVVAAAATARESEITRSRLRILRDVPWEVIALVAAGVIYGQIVTRGSLLNVDKGGVPHSSPYLLLFPVLAIAGLAGLGARGFKWTVARLRDRSDELGPASYLAVHRLAGASRLAVTLLTASGLAFGIFVYAQTMVTSLRATTDAKALIFTGGDVSVQADPTYDPPRSFPLPYTHVTQITSQASVDPSEISISIMAVDPATVASVSRWDSSFGAIALTDNMRSLARSDGAGLPALAVGDEIPDGSSLSISGVNVPLNIVDRPNAFPGMFGDRPWLVVGAPQLTEAVSAQGGIDPIGSAGGFSEIWVRGDPIEVQAELAALGFAVDESLSSTQVLQQPAFLSVTRTFGLLQTLGFVAALLVVIGILLYLQARQRARAVSYALSRRMGLGGRAHLRALVLELGGMLMSSALLGCVLGMVIAATMYKRIDPLPDSEPTPLLRIPLWVTLPVLLAAALATVVGAARAHRAAERTDFSEAMRHAV